MDFNPLHLINELNNAIGHGTASVLEFLHITDPAVNPSGVREVATKWRTLAGAVEDSSHSAQQAMHGVVWKGKAADAFSQRAHKVHGQAASTAAALHQGATAIDKFATEADDLIAEIGNICAQIEEMEVAGLALDVLTEGFASCAATIAAGERATKIVALIAKIEESGSALGTVIKTVTEAVRGLERILESLKDIKGVTSAAKMAGEGVKFTAIGTALQDPGTFTHPGKLLDTLAEGALLGVGFGAMGKALGKAVDTLSPAALSALSKSLCKLDDLIPEGSKLRPGEDDTIRAGIANALKRFKQDPIDVVTGEMMIAQTDAELPGILPLVLERTHLSSYRNGGWFGPSWASTLDQRLQLDDDGVVLATADGLRLCYPRPQPGLPALPERGPRMPLTWDGHPGSRMRVTDPATGRTLVFAHPTDAGADGLLDLPLQAVEDRNGNWIRIHHSIAGVPVEIEHHGGYRIAVDHHPTRPRITAYRLLDTDGPGTSTPLMRFDYDDLGHLTDVINSSDLPLRYTYDHAGRITSWTDRNHTSYHYTYDTEGRCIRGEGTAGYQSGTFTYDTTNRTTHVTNSLGHTTTVEYNDAYRPIRETDPLGNTTTTEWDTDNEHIVAITDPLGRTTRYEYDDDSNRTIVVRPDGTRTIAVYSSLGLPTTASESNGAMWRASYDERGNLLTITNPAGAVTTYEWDDAGNPVAVTDALGGVQRISCDQAGLPVAVTDELGRTTWAERNALGQVIRVVDPLGRVTSMGWTVDGKASWREASDGTREAWEWDGEGCLRTHTDQVGNITRHAIGAFDLPISRTGADGNTYTFVHDAELRLTQVTNPQGQDWTYSYDPAGRLVSETDFDNRTLEYAYDAVGNLTRRTNGAGETLSFTHDSLGRTLEQRAGSGEVTTFTYDVSGCLTEAVNQDARVAIERDVMGRIVAESVNGRTLRHTYDLLGRPSTRTTPAGASGAWIWDPTGQPVALTTDDGVLTFTYDDAGRETNRHIGETVLTQKWDAADRLTTQVLARRTQQTHVESPQDVLQRRAYSYRADGFLTEIKELTTGTRRFDLAPAGRVTTVRADSWTETYAYDSVGNLTHADAPGYSDPGPRQFAGTLIQRSNRTRYVLDAQGRLVRKTLALLDGRKKIWAYTWDSQDRLVKSVTPDGSTWTYTYDALGRRLSKQQVGLAGTRVEFTWDGNRLAEQSTADGTSTAWTHTPGTHVPLAQHTRVYAPPGDLAGNAQPSSQFHAVITDSTGTPTELLTIDGTVTWQNRTSLWGATLPSAGGATDGSLRFPGQYADEETGLHYNYFRYYDPESGLYLTPDPLGLEAAPHPYAYVDNPLAWTDPLGLKPCDIRVSSVARDWGDKGAHLHVGGDEVRVYVNSKGEIVGEPIRLRQGLASDSSVRKAVAEIYKNPKLRADLINKATSARENLTNGTWNYKNNRSQELQDLIDAVRAIK